MTKPQLLRRWPPGNIYPLAGFIVLLVGLLLPPGALTQNLTPNGIGSYAEFTVPMFAFRLDLATPSEDDEDILRSDEAKQLTVRVLAPDVTARQWSKFWIQNVSINTSSEQLSQKADSLIAITQAPRGSLERGDLVVFDRPSGDRLELRINDVLVYESADGDLFDVILSALLGPVPPTTELKDSLLAAGTIAGSDWELFDSVQPAAERVATIRSWLPPPEPTATELAAAAEAATTGSDETSPIPVETVATADANVALTDGAGSEIATASDAQSIAQAGSATTEAALAETTPATDSEPEPPVLTAEMLLEAQSYTQQVVARIYRNIRYPNRELELQRTGSTRVAVRINRDGSLHSSEVVVTARYSAFDRATLAAIDETFPVDPVPDAIADDPYEFILPVTFQLGR